mmetsp:Transcript_160015/g.298620  ORF Transcript_160015/g.298620 Transcript_160015/m.298620 type:complete len:210 (+) Transcript_160015:115-744(+)
MTGRLLSLVLVLRTLIWCNADDDESSLLQTRISVGHPIENGLERRKEVVAQELEGLRDLAGELNNSLPGLARGIPASTNDAFSASLHWLVNITNHSGVDGPAGEHVVADVDADAGKRERVNTQANASHQLLLEEDHSACMKDVTEYFGKAHGCVLQHTCNYVIRVRCKRDASSYWDYPPKGCCQLPPTEFGFDPCQGSCTVQRVTDNQP